MSARWSTTPPEACSGDMLVGVPMMAPSMVLTVGAPTVGWVSLATPKSSTLTYSLSPCRLMRKTLSVFTSRCTTPSRCAAASAEASWRMMCTERSMDSGPRPRRWPSVSPWSNSMTK